MTTFDLLLQRLEANPQDRTLLGVIADCADDQEFGSGDGWRALKLWNREPWYWGYPKKRGWKSLRFHLQLVDQTWGLNAVLPTDWFDQLGERTKLIGRSWFSATPTSGYIKPYMKAALAFNRLAPERKVELLQGIL